MAVLAGDEDETPAATAEADAPVVEDSDDDSTDSETDDSIDDETKDEQS